MNCPKKNPPKEGESVIVFGSDTFGGWRMSAIRKDYKQKPNVFAFKDGDKYWRFIHPETKETIKFVEWWI